MRNGAGIGVLIEELETAAADHRALVRQSPDEGLDLLGGKLLTPILARTMPTGGELMSRQKTLGPNLEAIHELEIRVHSRTLS
jgi:hypothetical protein